MPEGANDITLVADDWRLTETALHEDSFGSLMDWSSGPSWQLADGEWQDGSGDCRRCRHRRLRMINAANARTLAFRFQDARPLRVIALDGAPCDPFDVDTIRLARATCRSAGGTGGGEIALEEVSTGDLITVARLNVEGRAPLPTFPLQKAGTRVRTCRMRALSRFTAGARWATLTCHFRGGELPLRELAQTHSKSGRSMASSVAMTTGLEMSCLARWWSCGSGMTRAGNTACIFTGIISGCARRNLAMLRDVLRDTYLMARGTRRPGLHRRQSRMAVSLSYDGAPCRRHGRCDQCRLTMFAVRARVA